MIPAVFARTYPAMPAEALFERVRADGFEAVQFNLACLGLPTLPGTVPETALAEARRAAEAAGVGIAALSGTYNMAHPDPDRRAALRARFAHVAASAAALGAPVVSLCTGSRDAGDMWRAHPENGSAAAWRDLRVELDHALREAERQGLRLGIEPEPGNVVADARSARRLLDEVGADRLGVILDAANLIAPDGLGRQRAVMDDAVRRLGSAIVLAHAKDADVAGRVTATGAGAIDLAYFCGKLRAIGYAGAVVAHGFAEDAARRSGEALRRLLDGA